MNLTVDRTAMLVVKIYLLQPFLSHRAAKYMLLCKSCYRVSMQNPSLFKNQSK